MALIKYKTQVNSADKWISIHPSDVNALIDLPENTKNNIGAIPPSEAAHQVWVTDNEGNPHWESIYSTPVVQDLSIIYKYTWPASQIGNNNVNKAVLYRWHNIVQFHMYGYVTQTTWTASRFDNVLPVPEGFRPPHGAWILLPGNNVIQDSRFEIGAAINWQGGSTVNSGTTIYAAGSWITQDSPIKTLYNV